MYAMTCTRPDIAFEVGKVSRFYKQPESPSLDGDKKSIAILKRNHGLWYNLQW